MAGLLSRITRRAAPPRAPEPERAAAPASPVSAWLERSSEARPRPEPPRWGERNGGAGWAAAADHDAADHTAATPAATEAPPADLASVWNPAPAVEHPEPRAPEPPAAEALTRVAPAIVTSPLPVAPPLPAAEPQAAPHAPAVAPEPVPAHAPAPGAGDHPSFRHRARLRRRARYLRRLREVQLRDLGGLVLELDRAGHARGDLVRQKLDALRATTTELTALDSVLADPATLFELREPGVGGSCPRCRAVHGSADAFCAACGQDLAVPTPSET